MPKFKGKGAAYHRTILRYFKVFLSNVQHYCLWVTEAACFPLTPLCLSPSPSAWHRQHWCRCVLGHSSLFKIKHTSVALGDRCNFLKPRCPISSSDDAGYSPEPISVGARHHGRRRGEEHSTGESLRDRATPRCFTFKQIIYAWF